ncbi:helix-turn-helix transcriptional regulator [Streptomyces lavendulocolor]|uniref:helix-turn-helix transcriptional regulator n=1 Tax=Streptomyces lavendulocolor TaxID=67316 RepID=UPI0033ED795A
MRRKQMDIPGSMALKQQARPTLAEVKTWEATVGVPQAASALGCSKSHLYDLINRGEAPVKTLSFGRRHVVITQSLVTLLESA